MPSYPKGLRKRDRFQVESVQYLIDTLKTILLKRSYVQRDYPVLEYRRHLINKYGDDEKLIYDLDFIKNKRNQLSLRYDLTTQHIIHKPQGRSRTFQYGKVYRRENNSDTQSRYREFWQFDYDISNYPVDFAYIDILSTLQEILEQLKIDDRCIIKINDRRVINEILCAHDIPKELWNTVCSTVDKFEKLNCMWDLIEKELFEKKINNCKSLIDTFKNYKTFPRLDGIDDIKNIKWDISMVRGLNYYNGLIFEIFDTKTKKTIGGGGQYDKNIGLSLGLDRIIDIFNVMPDYNNVDVYLLAIGKKASIHAQKQIKKLQILNPTWKSICVYPIKTEKKIWTTISKLKKHSPGGIVFVYGSKEIENDGIFVENAMTL